MKKPSSAIQLLHDVRVKSQNVMPGFDDFFDYCKTNQELVKAICNLPESSFYSDEECLRNLNQAFFAKTKQSGKWVGMVEARMGQRNISAKKSSGRQKTKAKGPSKSTAPQL